MTTPAEIRDWLNDPASGPNVFRRNWNGKCQALVWNICNRFGTASFVYPSAIEAARATRIEGSRAEDAPIGTFHYWELGRFGHVALGLGGERVLMASTHTDELWATAAGVVDVSTYNARVAGRTYLGWGRTNGVNDVSVQIPTRAGAARGLIEEDDMPKERIGVIMAKASPQVIPGDNAWHYVDVNDGDRQTIFFGPGVLDGVATLHLENHPLGSEPIQVRLVTDIVDQNDRILNTVGHGEHEIHGSSGRVISKLPFNVWQTHADQRLRLQIVSFHEVRVVKVAVDALRW